jgi:fructose-1,6-bisphosphatase/inositol monophosphatase family enzyme
VAAGLIFWEFDKAYDIAAGALIAEEPGRVTNVHGSDDYLATRYYPGSYPRRAFPNAAAVSRLTAA